MRSIVRLLKTLFSIVLVPLVLITDFMAAQEHVSTDCRGAFNLQTVVDCDPDPHFDVAARLVTEVCRDYSREEWHATYAEMSPDGMHLVGTPPYDSHYEKYTVEHWGKVFRWGAPESLSDRESIVPPPGPDNINPGPGGDSEDALTNNQIQDAWRDAYRYFQLRVGWIMSNLFNSKDPVASIADATPSITVPLESTAIFPRGLALPEVLSPFLKGTVGTPDGPYSNGPDPDTGDDEWAEWQILADSVDRHNALLAVVRAQIRLFVESQQLALSVRKAAANMCREADPTGHLRDDLTLLADQIIGVGMALGATLPEEALQPMERPSPPGTE